MRTLFAGLLRFVYTNILKKLFFRRDPEQVHDNVLRLGQVIGSTPILRALTRAVLAYRHPALEQTILGIQFKNPVGLAAGFDKNARLVNVLPAVGFGFAELGSITAKPCAGNPKPRLWRLKKSRSLLVYYGLMNDGAEKIANRLDNRVFEIPIGTSIAKTNSPHTVATEQGIADYLEGFRYFTHTGSYYTVNISCPNAYGGQPFTDAKSFDLLMTELDKIPTAKPVFVKLSPDLSDAEVDAILEISNRHRVHGFVISNLTKNRENGHIREGNISDQGGMSGKIVEELSSRMLSYVYKKTQGAYVLIGCGGIFSAEDAYKKIRLGASLVQLITGMIYEGPQLIGEINEGLVRLLRQDGYTNISEAIGSAHKTA